MKLRQKLAVVLASAMVITAVPVTTMAASTNGFNKTLSIVAGHEITTDSGLCLKVDYAESDAKKIGSTINGKVYEDVFFINATDFKFTKEAYDFDFNGFDIEYLSETQLKVTVKEVTGTLVELPIIGTPQKGNPSITLDGEDSLATSGKYSLSGAEVVTDKVLAAKVGTVSNISVDGEGNLGDIVIEEAVAGSLAGKSVTITLPRKSDLEFKANQSLTVEGKRGFAKVTQDVTVTKGEDEKQLVITFGDNYKDKTRGSVVIKNIAVQAENRREGCSTGEVKVTVASDKVMEKTTLVVANVSEYGELLTVKETKEIVAGKGEETVKVKLAENTVNTFTNRQRIYFTVEGAEIADVTTPEGLGFSYDAKNQELTLDLADVEAGKLSTTKPNEFEFELTLKAKASTTGRVVVKAESKDFEKDLTVDVATVVPAVEVKAEAMTLKAGLKDQVGGKIAITETEAGRFTKNEKIIISSADLANGLSIKDAKVQVTGGDLEIKSEVVKNEIIVTVTRDSDEASTITVSDIKVTADRTVPEGTFDFEIKGDAITEIAKDAIAIEDFIVVGTKNTEDLTNAAQAKEIIFTVGSANYTVNGEAKQGVAAYIDENNRTMVPVRFVAEEFGKIDFGTVNGVGTVTVFKGNDVLQFQNGSNIMNKNGISIPMDAKAVIKDGRTYVPFKYVADGLGIGYSFDQATKSITFKN